jgi:hypothetical protein
MDEFLFDNYHKMGHFPQKTWSCGLFQCEGLAYFSDLAVSVKRWRDLEWGLKFHE